MEIELVDVEKPADMNIILGQSHFIKTAEDVYEALVNAVPGIQFGVAFCEASMKRLVRSEGTSDELRELAARNALRIGAGHSFIVMLGNAYPVNVLKSIERVPEVVGIFCATANPTRVVVAVEGEQRGILGVLDGHRPLGAEGPEDVEWRRGFLRKIGYKK